MKRFLVLVLFILNFSILSATHNRAGEITYIQLSDLTYEITITTFTYTLSYADRPQLDVHWGDNSVSTAPRISKVTLPNYYRRNIYKIVHTFPGPGIYRIVVQDPNRNYGVRNIPNSVNVVFSISTTLIVNPAMGFNNTPVLLNPPYDKAALGYIFIHNPAAYDPDGDSLSYALTVCTREDGRPIVGYTLPPATHYIRVDSVSGDLIWNTPADTGKYNVAMEIQEWRNNKKIGTVVRDMQIEVFRTNNKPPVNLVPNDTCIVVGDSITFEVSATDANNDRISLKATSGVFSLSCPAKFSGIDSLPGISHSKFRWKPCYEVVRNQPYNVIFKSDDDNEDIKLSDIDNMAIKVLGPSPSLNSAIAIGKSIRLGWNNYGTTAISGFSIYRREGMQDFIIDSCTSGVPASTGFVKVGYIAGSSTVSFTDTDNGQGLQFGKKYYYRICAVFKNGTESKPSNEIPSILVSGIPVIRNVSVSTTDAVNGSIYLAWQKLADSISPPYEYHIYRAQGVAGTQYSLVKSWTTSDKNDTVYNDNSINTLDYGYIYSISLRSNDTIVGDSSFASSVFITLSPGDEKIRFMFNHNDPWINTKYEIWRYNDAMTDSVLIDSTDQITYIDEGLENGKNYCYFVRSTGGYSDLSLPQNLVNSSQNACSTPVDNEPPCVPDINVTSQCQEMSNTVTWEKADTDCFNDIAGYKIYYKELYDENLSLIHIVNSRDSLVYVHNGLKIIAGCYAVSAFDSLGNESDKSVMVCVDSCNFFEIPNVFTPNNDGKNDKLVAKASGLVEKIDFKLYNRNGLLLFNTENPKIEWDGTYKGRIVSPGVYFYQCDVYERRITGLELFHLSGFVHIYTDESKVVAVPTK
ncbi:MAG: gliding motility-associated C-terminal domain-containing protein [Bacteroidia bacterium]|nr:gliding motility-associated C-terminal domain-containing protein [Bacteroidia bacterium]